MQTPTTMFTKATKEKIKVRLAISGASGSGKTFSALAIAKKGELTIIWRNSGKTVRILISKSAILPKFESDVSQYTKCNLDYIAIVKIAQYVKCSISPQSYLTQKL